MGKELRNEGRRYRKEDVKQVPVSGARVERRCLALSYLIMDGSGLLADPA